MHGRNITADNWRDKAIEATGDLWPKIMNVREYINAHEALLGVQWAGLFSAFMDNVRCDEERSVELYDRGLSRYPPWALVEYEVGYARFRGLGQLNETKRHYKKAAELSPDVAIIHYELGQLYHVLGLTDLSEEEFKAAAEHATHEEENEIGARALFNVGASLINKGENKDGERFARKAVERMPDYPEAQAALRDLERTRFRRVLPW
jgi:tetratricopeptide (TPR) repeat protein